MSAEDEREVALEVGQAQAFDDPMPPLRITHAGYYSLKRILDTWFITRHGEPATDEGIPGSGQIGC